MLLLYLFSGMERLVISMLVLSLDKLLISVVEFLNFLIMFIYLICLSDFWMLNNIIGWLLVIIILRLFMVMGYFVVIVW